MAKKVAVMVSVVAKMTQVEAQMAVCIWEATLPMETEKQNALTMTEKLRRLKILVRLTSIMICR